ncbi:hypothetical protein Prudu_005502 [Prunus dulcis]|uniref:Uncharacterized protein n=1 Tax=Prunus dulcis TaxID=3755 RepID=A0A4Y1QXT8_PRUDU|nr:hypothetical protein Prudu_005502 [Prunus dulcis]
MVEMVLDDELQALVLLSSLPDSWDTLVVSLSNLAPQGILTLDIVKDSMFNEEARRKEQGVVASQKPSSQSIVEELTTENSQARQVKGQVKRWLERKVQDKKGLDSGASFHVTSQRDFFTSYTNGDFGNVRMGNDKLSKIVGRGDISLETNTSCHLVLKDVRHVPNMHLNLISTGLLDDEGYTNVFAKGKWKLSKNSLILAQGKKENTIYMTHVKVSNGYVNALAENSIELWHKRLDHMSEKGLQILAKREAPTGMKKGMPLKSCMHCLAGKHHRASFQHGHAQRKPNVLDVVYSNVCGLMTTSTLGGARYFVTFIDDHSRKVWAYALRTKISFHASVERETSRSLKCICTNNGGEYMGTFRNYYRSNGIRHERSNKNNVISCQAAQKFWGEALMTAVDLINISPSTPLNGDVPNKVFVHIPKYERSKLDSKSKECIFMGYGNEEFGYRLWDPIARKIIRSRDVVFFEDQNIEDIRRANLDLVPPPLEHNDGRDESNDTNDPGSDPIINEPVDDDMSDDHTTNGIVDDVTDEGLEARAHEEPVAEFQPRRSTRVRRPPSRYSLDDYVLLIDEGEPEYDKEALNHDQQDEWLKAMHEKMQSLHENPHMI